MAVEQLSIFVENAPGRLFAITDILSRENVDMKALSVADTMEFGILRIIVSDTKKGYEALKSENITASITEVLAVKIIDKVGSLNYTLRILKDANVNIEYIYSFLSHDPENAYIIIRTDDIKKAEKALIDGGVKVVDELDL